MQRDTERSECYKLYSCHIYPLCFTWEEHGHAVLQRQQNEQILLPSIKDDKVSAQDDPQIINHMCRPFCPFCIVTDSHHEMSLPIAVFILCFSLELGSCIKTFLFYVLSVELGKGVNIVIFKLKQDLFIRIINYSSEQC